MMQINSMLATSWVNQYATELAKEIAPFIKQQIQLKANQIREYILRFEYGKQVDKKAIDPHMTSLGRGQDRFVVDYHRELLPHLVDCAGLQVILLKDHSVHVTVLSVDARGVKLEVR